MAEEYQDILYTLEMFNSSGAGDASAYVDLLITDSRQIYAASMYGTEKQLKQMAWLFQESKHGRARPTSDDYRKYKGLSRLYADPKKNRYDEHTGRTGELFHKLMISKTIHPQTKERQQFQEAIQRANDLTRRLPSEHAELVIAWDGDIESTIYTVLHDRYGTPMHEDWKDYVIEKLMEDRLFRPLNVYTYGNENNVKAGMLCLTEFQLEQIISDGVKSYELDFAIKGDMSVEDVLSDCESLDDYLQNFAGDLAECIQENVDIRFDPKRDKHHKAFKDVNLTANKQGITGLFPPQADAVMGVAETLKTEDYCFVIGEMGTGKTVMGNVSPYLAQAVADPHGNAKPSRTLIFSPSIMVEKWKREVKERVPNCEVYEIKHWTDVLKLKDEPYRPKKNEFYVMNSDLPQYTYPMTPIRDWRYDLVTASARNELRKSQIKEKGTTDIEKPRVRPTKSGVMNFTSGKREYFLNDLQTSFHCPKCGGPLYEKKDVLSGTRFFETRAGGKWKDKVKRDTNLVCKNQIENKYLPKGEVKDPNNETQECGYILWQPEKLELSSKKRKISPTWAINKFLRRGFFKNLIADEVHEYKSGDSKTANAFGQLINHTEKQVLLTGTLMGGMASDIFYLLARLDPKRLLREGITYKDESLFTQRYGIFEKKYQDGRQKGSAKKPGISPHLFPLYLMSNCVFLELADLGYALPPYEEIPVFVDMDEEHMRRYKALDSAIGSMMRQNSHFGGMRYVSTYINVLSQFSDLPYNMGTIYGEDSEHNTVELADAESFSMDHFTPTKVEKLVADIDREVYEEGRKCLVYAKYTGAQSYNQADTYLYEKLKALGYNVGILRSSGSYDGIKMPKNSKQREEWLKDQMEKNDWDVLITNPRLVKVGLDLLQFPNIMYFQMDYSTYDYMQASRRSWRIKQTKNVRVYTYVYKNTIQEEVLEHIAKKIDAAMAMQGKFSEEGLRAMGESDDGMNALAKKLMNDGKLDNVSTIHDRFQRLNQTYEEMQKANYEDYDHYEVNPIEGGLEKVKEIAQGILREMNDKVSAGTATAEELVAYMEHFDEMMKIVDDVKAYNKGRKKKEKVVEGQLALSI